ncbi:hypothetical protein [Burkholderia territorii]|uniref:Uncharacterized protein n=1 Tax=Burkholderia territorii TaxID=1503055 RepID=A0A6L3NP10_9BURK|nr:hypothetical protein [Burkholderia territorii]KAB0686343.1 hypothetical protein F7R13_01005 [Burkholderia territorii]MBM2775960.1 hypothetical protein [Burkholderia territorii]VWB48775.1 hypothetical protein BTE28158_02215 [Burkholderia territorii]
MATRTLFTLVVVALAVSGGAVAVLAQPAPAVPPPAAPVTVLAHAAQEIGVRRCYDAVAQVSARVFDHAHRADVLLDWQRTNPDIGPFFSLSGIEFPTSSALLSLVTVPGVTGGCSVLAERISSAPLSCAQVARAELAGYRATPLVKSVTVYTDSSHPQETVVLVDAPPSCLILRRQVQFQWGAAQ